MVLKMEAISGKQQLLALLAKAVETYKKTKGDHIKQTHILMSPARAATQR